jgi:hypothetical protein
MTKMNYGKARQRDRIRTNGVVPFYPASLGGYKIKKQGSWRPELAIVKPEPKYFGVSYVRVGDRIVDIGLHHGKDADLTASSHEEAMDIIARLRPEIVNDNDPIPLPAYELIKRA